MSTHPKCVPVLAVAPRYEFGGGGNDASVIWRQRHSTTQANQKLFFIVSRLLPTYLF